MSDLIYKPEKTESDIAKLLAEHKGLVYYILSEMNQLGNADAESAAWEGLWDAIGTFDIYSTTKFATYACTVVKNAVNNVLRKQAIKYKKDMLSMDLINEDDTYAEDDYYSKESIDRIYKYFSEYVCFKNGVTKNVLLFWYGADFSVTVSNIARACNCSPSYVSRVQDGFRAYLSGRLKRQ